MSDGAPRSVRDISKLSGLTLKRAGNALYLCWLRGLVLRTLKPICERESVNLGVRGRSSHTRPYHLYVGVSESMDSLSVSGRVFVGYSREHIDARGGHGVSKAGRVLDFLRVNSFKAFYSTDIVKQLGEHGVRCGDIMANARRFERQGLVYIRGYKTDERQSPFREGFLLTWIDQDKPREAAYSEAVDRTNMALQGVYASSPTMTRVNRVRDMVLEHSKLRSLVGYAYMEDQLGCNRNQAERAVTRALEFYPSIREVKLFGAYRYYYHSSMSEEDLVAATEAKRLSLRLEKGSDNRVGHNWEAAADWFIDKFTTGAKFWTQNHRGGKMDSRRITVYLLKGVGGRRSAAELDRVWEVNPSVFAEPITYVLSCKWGVVNKGHVDDFLEVLRWSKDFGVDTPSGREMKQGIVGVFAASAFNPTENVNVQGKWMSLAKYAALRRLQLVTAADFNSRLQNHGVPKVVTAQKICRLSKNEAEVRESIDAVWKQPSGAELVLMELRTRNQDLFKFEERLEGKTVAPNVESEKETELVSELLSN